VIALRRLEQKGLPAEPLPAAAADDGREVEAADPDLEQAAGLVAEPLVPGRPLASKVAADVRYRFPSTTTSIICGCMPRPPSSPIDWLELPSHCQDSSRS
jgi:hypothetical protein